MEGQSSSVTNGEIDSGVVVHFLDDEFYGSDLRPNSPQYKRLPMPFIQLNQQQTPFTLLTWFHSNPRICADGGANRIYDAFETDEERDKWIPHYIVGDLDSVRKDVLQYYEARGTVVINERKDQDTTDMEKSIRLLRRLVDEKKAHSIRPGVGHVLIDGGLGGRVDHLMNSLNKLLEHIDIDVRLTSASCVVYVLAPGRHIIRRNPKHESKTCGIIPLTQSTDQVRSKGLKWELDGIRMGFGNMISSSNAFVGDSIEISTDIPLLFSNVLLQEDARNPRRVESTSSQIDGFLR